MKRSERIPKLHELRLAGRVERARALFGPGGYLSVPDEPKSAEKGGPAATARPEDAVEGEGQRRGEAQATETKPLTAVEGSHERGGGRDDAAATDKYPKEEGSEEHSSQPSSAEHGRTTTKASHRGPPPGPALEATRLDGVGEENSRSARRLRAAKGGVTTVTLTIVGGRPNGLGFTNLEQSGKVQHGVHRTPEARACVRQAAAFQATELS